jgi:membrane-bound lytic murein transglycosylase A
LSEEQAFFEVDHPLEEFKTSQEIEVSRDHVTPTQKVASENWPIIEDDLDFENLIDAIDLQLAHFSKHPPQGTIQLGPDVYPTSWAVNSLERMKVLVAQAQRCLADTTKPLRTDCLAAFSNQVKREFILYEPKVESGDPRFGEEKTALFTGYYTPRIHATRTVNGDFKHAIYGLPGRASDRSASRVEIDFDQVLAGKGLDLLYGVDLFEFYMAHIQGHAHVIIDGEENTPHFLNYAGTNGLHFGFVSTYMMQKGYIKNDSISAQKVFLAAHPEKQREIYQQCPSYVYFKVTTTPPLGNSGVPVTPNRSIATDTKYYSFKGLLSFVAAERPEESEDPNQSCDRIRFRPFSRFFLDQDTGGAIRGKARADLFFGEGAYAELAASNEVQKGRIYFLMLKR